MVARMASPDATPPQSRQPSRKQLQQQHPKRERKVLKAEDISMAGWVSSKIQARPLHYRRREILISQATFASLPRNSTPTKEKPAEVETTAAPRRNSVFDRLSSPRFFPWSYK
jgi:hypothetical protein